jgi:3-carboxy-cis,cis-muconate cycloisomerase
MTSLVQATGAAVRALADAIAGLSVDPDRMRHNLDASGGLVCAERVMIRLGAVVGRDTAHALVNRAVTESRRTDRAFSQVLASIPEIVAHVSARELDDLTRPEHYLGAAEALRRRLLDAE